MAGCGKLLDGMKAAGILPSFRSIAAHDTWNPCHLRPGRRPCPRLLGELVAVTETATNLDNARAHQAIDARCPLDQATEAARAAGRNGSKPI
jgi:hypothetical protein